MSAYRFRNRDLAADLAELDDKQRRTELSDEYLAENDNSTRADYDLASDFAYGIIFVEATIARDWLERALAAEAEAVNDYPRHGYCRNCCKRWDKNSDTCSLADKDSCEVRQFHHYLRDNGMIKETHTEGAGKPADAE